MGAARTAVLRLTVAAAVLAATVAVGGVALAVWYERLPAATGNLSSGSVQLTADGQADIVLGPLVAAPQIGSVVVVHAPLEVGNAGTVPLDYALEDTTIAAGSTPGLVPGLQLRIATVGAAADCAGAAPGVDVPLTTGTAPEGAGFTEPRPLDVAGAEVLCISLTVPDVLSTELVPGAAGLVLHFVGLSR